MADFAPSRSTEGDADMRAALETPQASDTDKACLRLGLRGLGEGTAGDARAGISACMRQIRSAHENGAAQTARASRLRDHSLRVAGAMRAAGADASIVDQHMHADLGDKAQEARVTAEAFYRVKAGLRAALVALVGVLITDAFCDSLPGA